METPQNNPFLSSALIVGFIFALVNTVLSLVLMYSTIGSEPTGSLFSPLMLIMMLTCLIGLFAGLLAVKHHVGEYNQPLQLGRGAVIGLSTGAFQAVFITILSLLWKLFDPALDEKILESLIANFEAMQNISEAQKQDMIDSLYTSFQQQSTVFGQLKSLAMNGVFLGALNALSGLVGVKVFAPKATHDPDASI